MRKIILILSLCSVLFLFGCVNNENISNNTNQNENNSSENGDNLASENAIVVYFSATGNTERVATIIADYIDSPIYELEPVVPYTSEDLDYSDSNSRVSQERNDPNHLTELVDVDFEEFEEAEYVFLGAPVWWGELSWVINDFVLSNDFTNKAIIPFATASSSNFNVSSLRWLSEEATWLSGRRFRSSEINEETINSWVDSLNINFN